MFYDGGMWPTTKAQTKAVSCSGGFYLLNVDSKMHFTQTRVFAGVIQSCTLRGSKTFGMFWELSNAVNRVLNNESGLLTHLTWTPSAHAWKFGYVPAVL